MTLRLSAATPILAVAVLAVTVFSTISHGIACFLLSTMKLRTARQESSLLVKPVISGTVPKT